MRAQAMGEGLWPGEWRGEECSGHRGGGARPGGGGQRRAQAMGGVWLWGMGEGEEGSGHWGGGGGLRVWGG